MTPSFLDASEARFTFQTDAYGDELRVVRFSGSEGISELFQFGVQLAARDGAIDLDAIVGQPAQLGIVHPDGERIVSGIVSRFEQSVAGESFTPYFVELVPSVWFLTQRYKSRIFQNMTTEAIITQVLTDAAVSTDGFRFALQGTYVERTYCVQYRETDWNFVARLMEEEGIFFFFEHTPEGDVLVMADSTDVHVPIEGSDTVLFRDPSGTVEDEEYVYEFRYSQQVRPGTITLRDYNFVQPQVDLTKNDAADRDTDLEVYDYPGLYNEDAPGGELARIRLEAAQARRLTGQGQSVCRRMIPGYHFSLDEFPRADFNQDYLLTWIQHEGAQPLGQDDAGGHYRYNNHFRCIPASVPFRPIRKTPKPVVEGSQTAIVTGPSGEEIYVDEHGRVKVQFHWDREGQKDENSSCWIQVAQLWAGMGWGAMFIPRIGHEVIVDFLEGDPDRPIITGRIYNGDNTPPYPLDAEKTKSTIKSDSSKGHGGSNEIRFEDLKNSEQIYIHAQKDQSEVIEHNLSISVGNDMSTSVGHDQTLTVDNDRTKNVKGNETTTVKGDRTEAVQDGDEKITIHTGDRIVDINTGDEKLTVKTGDRLTDVNTGDDKLTVKTGDRIRDVNTGDDILTVKTGDQVVNVNTGDAALNVKTGDRAVSVNAGDYTVTTSAGEITLDAKTKLTAKAGVEMILGGPKVGVTGDATVEVSVGGSKITLSPASIMMASGSGQITIDASGVTIVGAMVKIN